MFAKIGTFHFGKDHSNPFGELRTVLEKTNQTELESGKGPIAGSLFVLPEAFNIRKQYRGTKSHSHIYPDDPCCLRGIAKEFGVAFVVGLVLEQGFGLLPRYSSAYLIDASSHILMCHKTCKDNFEGTGNNDTKRNYVACEVAECDVQNPYVYEIEEIVIGALVCVDAHPPCGSNGPYKSQGLAAPSPEDERRKRVMTCMDKSDKKCKIVCVPACISNDFWGGQVGQSIEFPCSNKIVVLANSEPHGVKSFITNESGRILDSVGDDENRVVIRPLKRNEQGTYTC